MQIMLVSGRVSRALALAIAFLMLVALVVIAEIGQSGQRQINRIISLSQQRQVLHHHKAIFGQRLRQLSGGPRFVAQQIQHATSSRIRECAPDMIQVFM